MHAPGSPALSTVALAAAAVLRANNSGAALATRRAAAAIASSTSPNAILSYRPKTSFHTSSARSSSNGVGGKPSPSTPSNTTATTAAESLPEQDVDLDEPQLGNDAIGGRVRNQHLSSLRSRQARRRASTALPPVTLPQTFLDENVILYDPLQPPTLPLALAEDAKTEKTSCLFVRPKDDSRARKVLDAAESYFDKMLTRLLEEEGDMANFLSGQAGGDESAWKDPRLIASAVRVGDLIIDAAWHLADAIHPAGQPEYTYKSRPFWWWHFYKDLDPRTQKHRDPSMDPDMSMLKQIWNDRHFDPSLAHAIADFPLETFETFSKVIGRDLMTLAPPSFDAKSGKRPINILAMSGYSGKAISESIGKHIAHLCRADIVHADAFDLSCLIGDYLGQNWAYSRGAVSMMGFRAAELNGKIAQEPEVTAKANEDDLGDADTNIINVRTSASPLEDELQKIKQGGFDCFTRWESLKIDKILDHFIHSSDRKRNDGRQRPVIIHIHDYVELNMTLEGSLIINRLRALVDAAWQQGKKIAILATSSCELPSEEYQTAIRDLAATDFVVTRHLQPDRADEQTRIRRGSAFNLQAVDMQVENASNICRMLRALGPDPRHPEWEPSDRRKYALSWFLQFMSSKRLLLPLPEIYQLATAVREAEMTLAGNGEAGFVERTMMGPLRQSPGQQLLAEEGSQDPSPRRDGAKPAEDAKAESRGGHKLSGLNEYEKRIASGLIDRESLRTTFADVHAPNDTISALKLLTSLALIRPDAFAYGVLAHDKITGCLLYGPPGTGKTMLAKAVAKQSGANMLEISGASVNDKWVGEAEKLIRAVFTLAKKLSPCVVFIDEADSLLANRSLFSSRASHREHINQFLKEWDGMEETSAFIMVATNRPFDLDDAVLRRLPRKILVDLPLRDDRAAILRLLLRDELLDDGDDPVSLDALADRTPYYSGSDLKNVCVAAAMAAVEEENAAMAASLLRSDSSSSSSSSSNGGSSAEPYEFPDRRTLAGRHFENALRQIPASISEDMVSLRQIRRFDEEYGNRRKTGGRKTMGFGRAAAPSADAESARVRQGGL